MTSFRDAVVVITGAGSGIGRASAITFSRLGARTILVDVQEEPVAKLSDEMTSAGAAARAFKVDVSDPRQVETFARTVLDDFKRVDVVVNSAGVLVLGELRLTSLEDLRWIMGVNFWGVIHMIQAFLPSMIERRQGHFVNISSPNGLAPLPFVGSYSASKAGVLIISETLRLEIAHLGIGVTTVCPGLTRTDLRDMARFRTDSVGAEAFLDRFRERARRNEMSPFKVARRIPPAILRNRAFVRISPETFLLSWIYRFAPRILRLAAERFMKRTM